MPLDIRCISAVGTTLIVEPISGYGWTLFDAVTNKHKSISNLPIPFAMEYREATCISGQLFGGVGYVTEERHQYFHWHVAFFTWLDEVVDLAEENASFQILVCRDKPLIEPQPGKAISTWLVNKEVWALRGFARIRCLESKGVRPYY